MPLTSLANIKAYLGIASSDTSDDALLEDLWEEAEDAATQVLNGRIIARQEHVLVLSGNGLDQILVPHYPIASIDSIHVDNTGKFGADTLLDPSEYYWDQDASRDYGAIWRREKPWPACERGNVKVTWIGGFDAIPPSLRRAVNVIAADLYMRAKQLASGQQQNELAAESVTGGRSEQYRPEYDECWGIPKPAAAALLRFRNPT